MTERELIEKELKELKKRQTAKEKELADLTEKERIIEERQKAKDSLKYDLYDELNPGDEFWYLNAFGKVAHGVCTGTEGEAHLLNNSLVHKTKESAEVELKVRTRLSEAEVEFQAGKHNYYLGYNSFFNNFAINETYFEYTPGAKYLEYDKISDLFLEFPEETIKQTLFMI